MRHYIKGVLSLWTVLTTIWTLLSFGLFAGLVKAYSEKEKEHKDIMVTYLIDPIVIVTNKE